MTNGYKNDNINPALNLTVRTFSSSLYSGRPSDVII